METSEIIVTVLVCVIVVPIIGLLIFWAFYHFKATKKGFTPSWKDFFGINHDDQTKLLNKEEE